MLVRYQQQHGGDWKSFEHDWFGNTLDYATVAVHRRPAAGTYDGMVTFVRSSFMARLWTARDWMVWIVMKDPYAAQEEARADKVLRHGRVTAFVSDGIEFKADYMTGYYTRGGTCPEVNYTSAPTVTKSAGISDQELYALTTEARQVMMIVLEALNRE